jgi:predicted MFS family arabinose efflux permease
LPVFWLLATPETAVLMVGAGSLTGTAAFAAATNASIKFMTRVPDRASRAMYVAVSASLNSIAAGVGALLGGWLLRTLGPAVLVLGVSLGTFHLLFWISLAARFLLVGTLLPRLRRPAIAGSPSPLPTPSTQI